MTSVFNEMPASSLRSKWAWFLGLGVLLLICGLIALSNLLMATVASVFYVGMLMLAGGVIYLVHAFQLRRWDQVLFWALSGVLYVLAGICAFINPIFTSAALTLFLSIALLVAGMVGDPDPYTATMNGLELFRIDDIVISTLPATRSGWLRADLITRVRNASGKPVDHIETQAPVPAA
jgi:hypothetical protein